MSVKDARSFPPATQGHLRQKAVRAVLGGKKQVEVAKALGVTRHAVGKWMKAYRQGGTNAIKAKPRGRPKGGSLRAWQAAEIVTTLLDRHPDQLQLPFYLWTREAVADLIEQNFGIRLSIWTVSRYLTRWEFRPQNPLGPALAKNPEQVSRWMNREYRAIYKQAKREKARIYWGDEVGLRLNHVTGRSDAIRGQEPEIVRTVGRFGYNMISATTNRGHVNFMVFQKRLQTDVFIEFMRRLVRQSGRKVLLIVDDNPVHRSRQARIWVQQNDYDIQLFFLPS